MKMTKKIVLAMLMFGIISENAHASIDKLAVGPGLFVGVTSFGLIAAKLICTTYNHCKENQEQVESLRKSLNIDEIAIFDAEYKSFDSWPYLYLSGVSTGLLTAFIPLLRAQCFEGGPDDLPEITLIFTVMLSFLFMADHLEDVNSHRFERAKLMLEKIREASAVKKNKAD